jgi:predicted nucleic acid-binding protein
MALLSPSKSILIDTCFWFAVYNREDQYHKGAVEIYNQIQNAKILIPWPTLYELLNTRFIKNTILVDRFELLLKKPNVERIDDKDYRSLAIEEVVVLKRRNISLVDSVIRQILIDHRMKIDYLVTFNEGDFLDILKKRSHIEIYYP